MKISKKTHEVLKNFVGINNSLSIVEPKTLKTVSMGENIIGIYDTEEKFPVVHMYNSGPFMSMINLFGLDKCEFEFKETFVSIKAGTNQVKIVYDDENLVKKLMKLKPSKEYKKFKNFDGSYELTSDEIMLIQKAASNMNLPDMSMSMTDGKGDIVISDNENPDTNSFRAKIKGTGDFQVNIMVQNLLIVSGDYTVSVSNDRMVKFHHKKLPLFYTIALKID